MAIADSLGSRESVLSQVGNTPLLKIHLRLARRWQQVHLKLEGSNPAGSAKDRPAVALLLDLEERGLLTPSSTVVESTSGNLGIALAFFCRKLGYPFMAVIDPKTTLECRTRMLSFGAQLDLVTEPDETGGYLLSRLRRVRELCDSSPRFVWTNQYGNEANPKAYYSSMAPEIYRQTERDVEAIFISVSTGGTLAGVGRYFREVNPRTRIIAVDAQGSVVFSDIASPRKLTGIGSSRKSTFIRSEHYDAYMLVNDAQAFAMCQLLNESIGLKIGGSSGAALYACARFVNHHPEVKTTVCICPDSGANYESTIFSKIWLQANGYVKNDAVSFVDRIALSPD